jgi:hypothetical protein
MNDLTMTTPRPVRRIRPKPLPLLLLPDWRVDAPAPAPVTAADARAGRARALAAKAARKAAAFQPPEVILINEAFAARVAAIAARRVVTACTSATSRPLAAG